MVHIKRVDEMVDGMKLVGNALMNRLGAITIVHRDYEMRSSERNKFLLGSVMRSVRDDESYVVDIRNAADVLDDTIDDKIANGNIDFGEFLTALLSIESMKIHNIILLVDSTNESSDFDDRLAIAFKEWMDKHLPNVMINDLYVDKGAFMTLAKHEIDYNRYRNKLKKNI